MNSPEELLSLAIALSKGDAQFGSVFETLDYLDIEGTMDEHASQSWALAADEAASYGAEVAFYDEFDEAIKPRPNVRIKVRIKKPNTETTYHAFTIDGLTLVLKEREVEDHARRILVAKEIEPFETLSCSFEHWIRGSSQELADDPLSGVEPRRFIYESVPGSVPSRVGNLILKAGDPPHSGAYVTWRNHVGTRLPLLLADDVRADDTFATLIFRRPRVVSVTVSLVTTPSETLVACEITAARWIFAEGAGVENRHTFFTSELGRIWPEGETWEIAFPDVYDKALEAAKSANALLLSGKTIDVLKSLGDLRKDMNDDVSRVTQQIRDLGSGLWRDFLIAVSALSARIALSNNDAIGARLIPVFAVVFLAYSVFVSLSANSETLRITRETRKQWMDRVYKFLSKGDTDALVSKPLTSTENVYSATRDRVVFAYGLLAIVLLVAAGWQSSWTKSIGDVLGQQKPVHTSGGNSGSQDRSSVSRVSHARNGQTRAMPSSTSASSGSNVERKSSAIRSAGRQP